MSNKGVEIVYGNVAVGAKENFVAKTADKADFVKLEELQYLNLDIKNYANPCEKYSVLLDGNAEAFPSDTENKDFGLWSESISDDNGDFQDPIVLELTSHNLYTSQGLTFTFDTFNNIFPLRMGIVWYRVIDGVEDRLGTKVFYPDSSVYFCYNLVENYNKVEIHFLKLNMPQNRLKLVSIDYGHGTIFTGDELRNIKTIQEINPISSEITINTTDFTLDSRSNVEYSFQAKQPLSVYFNGELKSTIFIRKAIRKAKKIWQVQGEDYIGLMDNVPYYGGIFTDKNAVDLLDDIFSISKIPHTIDDVFRDITLTGYIPYTSCREALMQVAFAIQAVVDTSNSDVVKIFALDDAVKQEISKDRIMQGQSFVDDETVTAVEVAAHSYNPISESVEVYNAKESGQGENIFVKFSEPLHDLSIANGEITEYGSNYAIINADSDCVLSGQRYEHTKEIRQKKNPIVSVDELEKIVAIENATLVSANNVDNVLEKCYNWLIKTNTINLKIVERKYKDEAETQVGDKIKVGTEYLGTQEGIITKQTFSLIGGIIIKDTVMR